MMWCIAIVGDLVSIVPILNIVSDFVTGLLLGLAASPEESIYSHNIELTLATYAIEFVPEVSMIPSWTARVAWAKWSAKQRGAK